MKTIVLDTNELARDWMLTGLKYQLFDHIHHASWFSVYVPAIVLEELVASHARAVAKVEAATQHLERDRRLVGLPPVTGSGMTWDYRQYNAWIWDLASTRATPLRHSGLPNRAS